MVNPCKPTLGIVIRFRNSASTLLNVLEGLRNQTIQPDLVVGVDNQSTDSSRQLLEHFGAQIVEWNAPYSHARVLNHGVRACPTDLVLALSSHTTLRSPDALARLIRALDDPRVACASGKWDSEQFYSDAVTWPELQSSGIKLDSIFSNSFGLLRRRLWEECPFDETIAGMEDYAWALEQVKRGYICRRVEFDFSYDRPGRTRYEIPTLIVFKLAARYGLRVVWLGPKATTAGFVKALLCKRPADDDELRVHRERLWAWLTWRWRNPSRE